MMRQRGKSLVVVLVVCWVLSTIVFVLRYQLFSLKDNNNNEATTTPPIQHSPHSTSIPPITPTSNTQATTTSTTPGIEIVIAIPSAIRKTSQHPLESLLDSLLRDFENQPIATATTNTATSIVTFSHIVVMNVEIPAESHTLISQLEKKYRDYIERKRLIFFSHDNEQLKLYQKLLNTSTIKRNYGDGIDRVLWRSKENLDFAHVLKRACEIEDIGQQQQQKEGRRPKYVLFLEDDTIPTSNMMQKLTSWLQTNRYQQREDQWFVLSFYNPDRSDIKDGDEYYVGCCTQAMLFQCRDIPRMSSFVISNFDEKPVDWLLSGYFVERRDRDQRKSYIKVPNLFQHMKVISSFTSKGTTGHQSLSFVP